MRISDWSSDVCSSDLVRKREIDANRGTAGAQSEINLLGERGRVTGSENGNEILEIELSAFVFERRPVDLQRLQPTGKAFDRTGAEPQQTLESVRGAQGVRALLETAAAAATFCA